MGSSGYYPLLHVTILVYSFVSEWTYLAHDHDTWLAASMIKQGNDTNLALMPPATNLMP